DVIEVVVLEGGPVDAEGIGGAGEGRAVLVGAVEALEVLHECEALVLVEFLAGLEEDVGVLRIALLIRRVLREEAGVGGSGAGRVLQVGYFDGVENAAGLAGVDYEAGEVTLGQVILGLELGLTIRKRLNAHADA